MQEKCNPHAFGQQAARNGCPTLVLQELMGHALPETTRLYTFLDEQDLAALHAQDVL